MWRRKCGVYRGTLSLGLCIRLCVCVSRQSFPNEIDFGRFSPAFKGGQTESSSHQVHKLSLLVEMSGGDSPSSQSWLSSEVFWVTSGESSWSLWRCCCSVTACIRWKQKCCGAAAAPGPQVGPLSEGLSRAAAVWGWGSQDGWSLDHVYSHWEVLSGIQTSALLL